LLNLFVVVEGRYPLNLHVDVGDEGSDYLCGLVWFLRGLVDQGVGVCEDRLAVHIASNDLEAVDDTRGQEVDVSLC
jgi:hypothetical protein